MKITLEDQYLSVDTPPLNKTNLTIAEAIGAENLDELEIHFQNNADFSKVDEDGKHAIHLAAFLNKVGVLRYFIEEKKMVLNIPYKNDSTAIHFAAQGGSLESLIYLLNDKGMDIDTKNSQGKTPLHFAAKSGYSDIIRYLVNQGATIDVLDSFGWAPLHWAASNGNLTVVECLIELGANILAKVEDPQNGRYSGYNALQLAAICGKLDIVECLISKGLDPKVKTNDERALLHLAATSGNFDTVKYIYEQKNTNINDGNSKGKTSLHFAALSKNSDIIRYLVDQGANINALDSDGWSPLHLAALDGKLADVECLIELGANIFATIEGPQNIPSYGFNALQIAVGRGKLDIVECLISKGLDPKVKTNDGKTLLHLAATSGNLDTVKCIYEQTEDVKALTELGGTPLHYATVGGHLDITEYLLEKNAEDINAKNKHSQTPLHFAVISGSLRSIGGKIPSLVKCLIDKGADIEAEEIRGTTPLFIAVEKGDLETLKCLIELKADVNTRNKKNLTPLLCTVIKGNLDVAKYLLDNGADTEAVLPIHEKVLQYVAQIGNLKAVKLLIENGAKCNLKLDSGLSEDIFKHIKVGNFIQSLFSNDSLSLLAEGQEIKEILKKPANKAEWLEFAKKVARSYALKIEDFSLFLNNISNYHEILDSNFIHSLPQEIQEIKGNERNMESLDSDLLYYTGKASHQLPKSIYQAMVDECGSDATNGEILSFDEGYKVPGLYIKELAAKPLAPDLSLLSAMMFLYPEMNKCMSALSLDHITIETRKVIVKSISEYNKFKLLYTEEIKLIEEVKKLISESGDRNIVKIFEEPIEKPIIADNPSFAEKILHESNVDATEDQNAKLSGENLDLS
jgi:ankyrin repeat protein